MNDLQTEFNSLRLYLTGLAYRLLGSRVDAEDAVQETWIRLQSQREAPENAKAWLTRVCTNVCLDTLRRLKRERSQYDGPWLPDPVERPHALSTETTSPAELAESLQQAYLLLLERLTPSERASLLLHDVFGFSFSEVSEMLGQSQQAVRQQAVRARKHLKASKTRFDAPPEALQKLGDSLYAALTEGDIDSVVNHLASDVELWTDAGGKARAARNVIVGPARVAAFLSGVHRKFSDGTRTVLATFNGTPSLMTFGEDGNLVSLITVSCNYDGKINHILAHRNPEKLGDATRALSLH